MQAVNTMTPLLLDTTPLSMESGPVSGERAAGLPSGQDTWMAAVETLAAVHEDSSARETPTIANRPVAALLVPEIDQHREAMENENNEKPRTVPGEQPEPMPAQGPDASAKQNPAGPEFWSGNPAPPVAAREKGGPGTGENLPPTVNNTIDLPVFEKAATSAAKPNAPETQLGKAGSKLDRPSPVERQMGKTAAGSGSAAPPLQDGEPDTAGAQRPTGVHSAIPEPVKDTRVHQAAHPPPGWQEPPDTLPQPPGLSPAKNHPAMVMPRLTGQYAETQHPTDAAGSMSPENRPVTSKQQAHARARQPAPAAGLPEKQAPETGFPLPERHTFRLVRAAGPASSAETSRLAPTGGLPPNPAPVVAEHSTTGAAPARDDVPMLPIAPPLWSAVGTGGLPAGENGQALPGEDSPSATQAMRTLSNRIEKVYWHQKNGRAQARIQIKPAFLGHLHLNVLTEQTRVSVEIRVESPLAREFIEMNLLVLKTDLQNSGLEIDKIDVIVDQDMDNPREEHRDPARKPNRRAGAASDMAVTETNGNQGNSGVPGSTDGMQSIINYFA